MRFIVLSIGALVTLGLLLLAGHIAWQEIQTLRYLNQLDEWAEDIPEWH